MYRILKYVSNIYGIIDEEIASRNQNLNYWRVYSCHLLSPNGKKIDIDTITLQKLRNFPRITIGKKDRC